MVQHESCSDGQIGRGTGEHGDGYKHSRTSGELAINTLELQVNDHKHSRTSGETAINTLELQVRRPETL